MFKYLLNGVLRLSEKYELKRKINSFFNRIYFLTYLENGIDMEVLKICNIEEISSLLSPLNLGSRIKFKRKLEEFQKGSVWVEICTEVSYRYHSFICFRSAILIKCQ